MLTDSNDGARLRLFVLVTVDGDGAEENESKNCEERERYRAKEGSTLPPRRATIETKVHGEGKVRNVLNMLVAQGCLTDARVSGQGAGARTSCIMSRGRTLLLWTI